MSWGLCYWLCVELLMLKCWLLFLLAFTVSECWLLLLALCGRCEFLVFSVPDVNAATAVVFEFQTRRNFFQLLFFFVPIEKKSSVFFFCCRRRKKKLKKISLKTPHDKSQHKKAKLNHIVREKKAVYNSFLKRFIYFFHLNFCVNLRFWN